MSLTDDQKRSIMQRDPRYKRVWGHLLGPIHTEAAPRAPKPRLSIDQRADLNRKISRCQQAKAAGRPCTEFAAPQPTPAPAPPTSIVESPEVPRKMTWAYGVTTVSQRRATLLPQTLASLSTAGWPAPVLFVDGIDHNAALSYEREFNLPVVNRWPRILTFGTWILGLAELFIRNPSADRFAMFQDDALFVKNLRQYLEAIPYPDGEHGRPRGYLNCYTFDFYYHRTPRDRTVRQERIQGWFPSPTQQGLGAVALVFDRESVWDLLTEKGHIVTRPAHAGEKSWRNIDGGIVDAMNKQGRKEFVHSPSLVQHLGLTSTMKSNRHPSAKSFPGVDFDALDFLKAK